MSTVVYCARGRELRTAIAMSLAGVHTDRILPTDLAPGDTVLLIDDGAWNGAIDMTPGDDDDLPARRRHPVTARPETVLIDGVRYVPVTDANPSVAALEDAIIGQWGGSGWRTDYPHAPRILRVIVSDTAEDGEGESVTDFLARLVQSLPGGH